MEISREARHGPCPQGTHSLAGGQSGKPKIVTWVKGAQRRHEQNPEGHPLLPRGSNKASEKVTFELRFKRQVCQISKRKGIPSWGHGLIIRHLIHFLILCSREIQLLPGLPVTLCLVCLSYLLSVLLFLPPSEIYSFLQQMCPAGRNGTRPQK